MRIGMVGLGRMGANMTRRLIAGGIEVAAFDASETARQSLAAEARFDAVTSLAALVAALPRPRVVWMMLPAGDVSEGTIVQLAQILEPDDLLVDGANAYYKDSMPRADGLAARGIHFV